MQMASPVCKEEEYASGQMVMVGPNASFKVNEWMDGWMDWMDWMDGWMDG